MNSSKSNVSKGGILGTILAVLALSSVAAVSATASSAPIQSGSAAALAVEVQPAVPLIEARGCGHGLETGTSPRGLAMSHAQKEGFGFTVGVLYEAAAMSHGAPAGVGNDVSKSYRIDSTGATDVTGSSGATPDASCRSEAEVKARSVVQDTNWSAWSDCMRAAGYHYESLSALQRDYSARSTELISMSYEHGTGRPTMSVNQDAAAALLANEIRAATSSLRCLS